MDRRNENLSFHFFPFTLFPFNALINLLFIFEEKIDRDARNARKKRKKKK